MGKGGDIHNVKNIGYEKVLGYDIVEDNIINI